MGLWAKDVHQGKTSEWAKSKQHGMVGWAANMVAEACNDVDPSSNPFARRSWVDPSQRSGAGLSWHFDFPHDATLVWGPTDSRYDHAERELAWAIFLCGNYEYKGDAVVHDALRSLGKALHPVQDWVAHGTWDPTWTKWYHTYHGRAHPGGSDDFTKDFRQEKDGILRDCERDGQGKKPNPQFVTANLRATLTETRTLEYLNRFKGALDKQGCCYYKIYVWK